MKIPFYFLLIVTTLGASCSSKVQGFFTTKTPHEKYEAKLERTGLDDTIAGREWFVAAENALMNPDKLELPFQLNGRFPADKSQAIGISFNAKQGEKVFVDLDKDTIAGFILYADLYQVREGVQKHLLAPDSDSSRFTLDIEETGTYILRVQPELNAGGAYDLSVSSGPSVGFPVSGNNARAGSFWGDSRDGGKRLHEGVDIFAPKRTPVVAVADGYVSAVREGGLGGKTVWLRSQDRQYSFYYAHLDEQLVSQGQFVKKGDVLGLVGNTGNAKTTPPHLHFGIYGTGGAVDPYPFINKFAKTTRKISDKKLNSLRPKAVVTNNGKPSKKS